MSRHDDETRLRDMVSHAREAIEIADGRSRADLDSDRVLNLALARLVMIVGEAASRVSRDRQSQIPELPWPQIVGMRNRLTHGYAEVDLDILWATVMQELPPLIRVLEGHLKR